MAELNIPQWMEDLKTEGRMRTEQNIQQWSEGLTDYQRIATALAEHGRSYSANVYQGGMTLSDCGSLRRRALSAVVFTFDEEGQLMKIRRRLKAAWLMRSTSYAASILFARRFQE